MSTEAILPTPENLGEGPEARMTNIPRPKPVPHQQEGDHLTQQPGIPKPEEADAVGEGDVEELSQETDGRAVEEWEERTQADPTRAIPVDPPLDIRRRLRETRPPDKGIPDAEVEGP